RSSGGSMILARAWRLSSLLRCETAVRYHRPVLTGRSSIPEAAVLEPIGRGVLDRPLELALGRRFSPTRGRAGTPDWAACICQDSPLRSRGTIVSESCMNLGPSDLRGRREGRVSTDTHGPRAIKKHGEGTTGSAGGPGLPCAMVLTLIARSPREPGLIAP